MSQGAGRPEFQPTEDQRDTVRSMAAYGVPQFDIARVIGCSVPTLRKHFFREVEISEIEATARVAQTLFAIATKKDGGKDSLIACIFWLKCRGGWRERDGQPEIPGKKEEQRQAALNAGAGTDWGDLLSPPASSLN